MGLGGPTKTIIVEPIEVPTPRPREAPAPEKAPAEKTPEKVPA